MPVSETQTALERLRNYTDSYQRLVDKGEWSPNNSQPVTFRELVALLDIAEAAQRDYENGFISQELGRALASLDESGAA